MRLKTVVAALSLSLVCIVSRASFADTLKLTGVGGANTDGVYTYPYIFTVTGPGGTSKLVDMSCLSFDREVTIGESWGVTVYEVSSITPGATIDGESGIDFLADAYLYNQYAAAIATDNASLTTEIQFAIWDIMDPSGVSAASGGYNITNAQNLAAEALDAVNSSSLNTSQFANDYAFVPSDSYPNGGEPQIFMTDPAPPAITPEPTSLILLGTGLPGAVGILRRKLVKA